MFGISVHKKFNQQFIVFPLLIHLSSCDSICIKFLSPNILTGFHFDIKYK